MKWRFISILFVAIFLPACAGKILRIRDLATPMYPAEDAKRSSGSFLGLDRIADFNNSNNINILFVHGIGWTQQNGENPFGLDLVNAISDAYGVNAPSLTASNLCPPSKSGGESPEDKPGLTIKNTHPIPYLTDDPQSQAYGEELGCLDRIRIYLKGGKSITVYRFFWDDKLWDSYEGLHLRYDTPQPQGGGSHDPIFDKFDEDLSKPRAKKNLELKNDVVTYGLSDAAMYIGPIGELMREGVRGAICAAVQGYDIGQEKGETITADALCSLRSANKAPFLLMSHSLGSRIAFDVMVRDLKRDLADKIKAEVKNETVEVYMLANQIPLVGVGRLGEHRSGINLLPKKIKFVAVSEINDLLTYELVPYFERLYTSRCLDDSASLLSNCRKPTHCEIVQRIKEFSERTEVRHKFIDELGYDVVDVRAEFASPLIPFYFMKPDSAHTEYLKKQSVVDAIICGAENGQVQLNSHDRTCPAR